MQGHGANGRSTEEWVVEKPGPGWREADGGVVEESRQREKDVSLGDNGGQGRGGTFSSKKVDCTQESGSPRRKRERDRRKQEGKLHQVTTHSGLSGAGAPCPY